MYSSGIQIVWPPLPRINYRHKELNAQPTTLRIPFFSKPGLAGSPGLPVGACLPRPPASHRRPGLGQKHAKQNPAAVIGATPRKNRELGPGRPNSHPGTLRSGPTHGCGAQVAQERAQPAPRGISAPGTGPAPAPRPPISAYFRLRPPECGRRAGKRTCADLARGVRASRAAEETPGRKRHSPSPERPKVVHTGERPQRLL